VSGAEILFVPQSEVPSLLPMADCIEEMAAALSRLARREAILPLRTILWLPDRRGALGLMPGALLPERVLGVKAITFFPGNEGTELDSHQGAVLLFEAERGRLLAVIDATSVTAIRTAAVSAVATRALAREDADDVALVGSGVQARTHLEAMLLVRPIRRVRVASKSLARANGFAARESRRLQIAIEPVATVRAAIQGADIVCAVTSAREPVIAGEWLEPGCHVNAVGSSVPTARELDTAAVKRARLYVDRRESAVNEAGDFLIPRKEGAIGDEHILAELGEVLIGVAPGRRSSGEITLFKSLGLAVEDVAAARRILENATRTGRGRWLALGGERHAED
jgi:ornithine cyclodeaminase